MYTSFSLPVFYCFIKLTTVLFINANTELIIFTLEKMLVHCFIDRPFLLTKIDFYA